MTAVKGKGRGFFYGLICAFNVWIVGCAETTEPLVNW